MPQACRRALALLLALAVSGAGVVRSVRAEPVPDVPNVFAPAVEQAQRRCVKIFGAGTGTEVGYATGLIVSGDGLILTAQGIYLAGERIRVVLPDGSLHLAQVVRRSESLQAVLLKIEAETPDYFELPTAPNAHKGDWVLTLSNLFKVADRAEPLSVSLGVVSLRTRLDARHRTQDVPYDADVLVVDAITSNPGASGGAVIDAQGNLVGMVGKLLIATGTNTRLNYAVPADLLHALVAGKEETPPANPSTTVADGKAELGLRLFVLGGRRGPAYIDRVVPGSPAATAGLRKDDLIVTLDGQTIRDIRDYDKVLERLRPGTTVPLLVKRGNDVLSIQIVPAAGD